MSDSGEGSVISGGISDSVVGSVIWGGMSESGNDSVISGCISESGNVSCNSLGSGSNSSGGGGIKESFSPRINTPSTVRGLFFLAAKYSSLIIAGLSSSTSSPAEVIM